MTKTMRALVLEKPKKMVLKKEPIPTKKPEEILIRVGSAAICGSELGGYLGTNTLRTPPVIMGHEGAGTIAESSDYELASGGIGSVGEIVVFNPLVTCGACRFCISGRDNLCPHRQLVGAHRPGAFAEYLAIPAIQCHVVTPSRPTSLLVWTEPLACAVRARRLAGLTHQDRLWVMGCGPIGLCCIAAAHLAGLKRILASDPIDGRRDAAEAWGAARTQGLNHKTGELREAVRKGLGGLPTVVIDAVGSETARQQALEIVEPGERVILLGLHDETSLFPASSIVRGETVVRGSFAYAKEDFAAALELVVGGALDFSYRWSDVRPLADGAEAFEDLSKGTFSKSKIILSVS